MSPKKPSSNARALQTLRAESPDPAAVDRAVAAFLAAPTQAPTPANRPKTAVLARALPWAAGLGAFALVALANVPSARAVGLREIAAALRLQTTRHSLTYRPGKDGALRLTNEDWIDGPRHAEVFVDEGGKRYLSGYDGARMYRIVPQEPGFVDDVEPDSSPIENLDDYLNIPGGHLEGRRREGPQDVYTLAFSNMKDELYIDPATHLPARRDVLTLQGGLIERNLYDYPARMPAARFRPPAAPGIADYPALRRTLAARLDRKGQSGTVGGVTIDLKAVIVGPHNVLALWTGGAPGAAPGDPEWREPTTGRRRADADMTIEGRPERFSGFRPEAFTFPYPEAPKPLPGTPKGGPFTPRGERLLGDRTSLMDTLPLAAPFTIDVPVWKEDRTRPVVAPDGTRLGYRSRLVGRLKFRVTDPILAPDPDRVVWRPDGKAVGVATAAK